MLHSSIHATADTTATIKRSTLQSDRLASIIVHHLFPDQPKSSIMLVMNLVCHLGHAAYPASVTIIHQKEIGLTSVTIHVTLQSYMGKKTCIGERRPALS